MGKNPHIVLLIARGEAVRNFIYSDTLSNLSKNAKVTILSSVNNDRISQISAKQNIEIHKLEEFRENPIVVFYREIVHTAHYQYLWNTEVKYYWGRHNLRVKGNIKEFTKLWALRILGFPLSNKPLLRIASYIEKWLSQKFCPSKYFVDLFRTLKPDLIFNCSHIHGTKADLPIRVASKMNIKTGAFIFSWDNLTSRGRIFPQYNHYLVWNKLMCEQLLRLYSPSIKSSQIHITGTPQFDFHFKEYYSLNKKELSEKVGIDYKRPYILYTTGMATDFPDEHKILLSIIHYLKQIDKNVRPQLVVRTYAKGTSNEMVRLQKEYFNDSDVFFPPILWDSKSLMPFYEDLFIYSNLIRHSKFGINAASTVTLELMMFRKHVINIGFEPPKSYLPYWKRFSRHIKHAHFRPVVSSKAVLVAKSLDNLNHMIDALMKSNYPKNKFQNKFLKKMFDNNLDGKSGLRVARTLLSICNDP